MSGCGATEDVVENCQLVLREREGLASPRPSYRMLA